MLYRGDEKSLKITFETIEIFFANIYFKYDRVYHFVGDNPLLLTMRGKGAKYGAAAAKSRENKTIPRETTCFLLWAEDELKRIYIKFLQMLNTRAKDTIGVVRKEAVRCLGHLLNSRIEQKTAILDLLFWSGFNDNSYDVFHQARSALHIFMEGKDENFIAILNILKNNMRISRAKERSITRALNLIGNLNKVQRNTVMDLETYKFYIEFMNTIVETESDVKNKIKSESSRGGAATNSRKKNEKGGVNYNEFVARRIRKKQTANGLSEVLKEKKTALQMLKTNIGSVSHNRMLLLLLSGFEQVVDRLKKSGLLNEEQLKDDLKIVRHIFKKTGNSPGVSVACLSLIQKSLIETGSKVVVSASDVTKSKTQLYVKSLIDSVESLDGPYLDHYVISAIKNANILHNKNQKVFWKVVAIALACDRSPSRAIEQWLNLMTTALFDYQERSSVMACWIAQMAGRRQKSLKSNLIRLIRAQRLKLKASDYQKLTKSTNPENMSDQKWWNLHLLGQHINPGTVVNSYRILCGGEDGIEDVDKTFLNRNVTFALRKGVIQIDAIKDLNRTPYHKYEPEDILEQLSMCHKIHTNSCKPETMYIHRYYNDETVVQKLHRKRLGKIKDNLTPDERIEKAYDEEIDRVMSSIGGTGNDDEFISDEVIEGDDSNDDYESFGDSFGDEMN